MLYSLLILRIQKGAISLKRGFCMHLANSKAVRGNQEVVAKASISVTETSVTELVYVD